MVRVEQLSQHTLCDPALSSPTQLCPHRWEYSNVDATPIFMTKASKKRRNAHGFHPRSCGFTYRMPALETVAGVAVCR